MKTSEKTRVANREAAKRYRQNHPGRAAENVRKWRENLSPERLVKVLDREAAYRHENAEYLKGLSNST
jgi:hypothetical protein